MYKDTIKESEALILQITRSSVSSVIVTCFDEMVILNYYGVTED